MAIPVNQYNDIQPGAFVIYRHNAYVVVAVSNGNAIAQMHEKHGNSVFSVPFTDPDLSLLYKVADVPPGFTTMDYIDGGKPTF